MWKRQPTKGLNPLDRKVKTNPKYGHVVGKLNTGLTVDKLKNLSVREYAKRRDEIFYRVNKRQLNELFGEYEQDEEYFGGHGGEEVGRGGPRIVTHTELATPAYDKPYLLLDVRPAEEFAAGHLLQARSYPYTLIRRDFTHPEIYKFKNVENHLIIVYCNDEKISRDVAKTLVDRGSDNVFLLTGGMFEMVTDYPHYVEGRIPELPSPPGPQRPKPFAFLHKIREDADDDEEAENDVFGSLRSARGPPLTARSSASSRAGGGGVSRGGFHPPGTGRSRRSTAGRDDDTESVRSTFSVAESIYSRATAKKGLYR